MSFRTEVSKNAAGPHFSLYTTNRLSPDLTFQQWWKGKEAQYRETVNNAFRHLLTELESGGMSIEQVSAYLDHYRDYPELDSFFEGQCADIETARIRLAINGFRLSIETGENER
ncbi:MAG: hypothetical protein GKR87_12580 [Kiritimatiellae bacterium]|nr:hypothetical protein [Kiritimatiellia bacterium]